MRAKCFSLTAIQKLKQTSERSNFTMIIINVLHEKRSFYVFILSNFFSSGSPFSLSFESDLMGFKPSSRDVVHFVRE